VRCEGGGSTTLAGKIDPYGGIIVDALALPHDLPSFEARLDASLAAWRGSNVRGVWLKIPIRKSVFISAAVDRGFAFHHAEPAYCMLTHWLPTGEANPLPRGPSTQVGVGALVVNQEGKVLLVQEAVGASAGKNIWKIPTGVLEPREDIRDGAERELLEEVGLRAQFVKVLGFRHTHALPFGKSDMFFVCLLRATCKDASQLTLQRSEIAKAKWADIREFLEQAPYPRDMPVWAELYAACVGTDGVVGNVRGIRAEKVPATPDPKGRQEYYYF